MTTPVEDKALEEYLRRKSALSMGYRKLYVEAPPPELDRAVKARAKRALRWLLPGLVAFTITASMICGLYFATHTWVSLMVQRERELQEEYKALLEKKRQEDLKKPVVVTIDASKMERTESKTVQMTRKQWRDYIEALRKAGWQEESDLELARYRIAYPDDK